MSTLQFYATLRLLGVKHQLRSDLLVELLGSQEAQRHCSLLQRRALFVGLLRAFRDVCGHSVSNNPTVTGIYVLS